jgi:hypothetical protein
MIRWMVETKEGGRGGVGDAYYGLRHFLRARIHILIKSMQRVCDFYCNKVDNLLITSLNGLYTC